MRDKRGDAVRDGLSALLEIDRLGLERDKRGDVVAIDGLPPLVRDGLLPLPLISGARSGSLSILSTEKDNSPNVRCGAASFPR